jgi:hypothetical protein
MRLALFIILLVPTIGYSEMVVLNAIPQSKIISSADATERTQLNESQQNKFRLLITKKNGKYYWASRKNRELIRKISGAVHILFNDNYYFPPTTIKIPVFYHGC